MWKKIASLAAMLSTSLTVSACTTSAGKPECLPAFDMKGRCAKVPQSIKDANRVPVAAPMTVMPKAATTEKRSPTTAPSIQKLDAYGQPL